ncbi:MAG: hypothetical protein WC777_01505 [Candidatus Gracilibacteria bacterium]|jgi:hypothetical protein
MDKKEEKEEKLYSGERGDVPGRITVNGHGGCHVPKGWGPIEADPDWIAMQAAKLPPLIDYDKWCEYHDTHAEEVDARLRQVREKFLLEAPDLLEGLRKAEADRKAKR